MKIGDLARRAECPTVTIRYYEKIGLLPGDKRDRNNHRVYDAADMDRLRFIKHCRNHKITLRDIRFLLDIKNGAKTNRDTLSILKTHIDKLQLQRQSLEHLIDNLSALLNAADKNNTDGKEILDVLASPCPDCPDYTPAAAQDASRTLSLGLHHMDIKASE